jgi:hypothetical protein
VSFLLPSRFNPTERDRIGGLLETALKYENGARFN